VRVVDFHIHLFPPEVAADRGKYIELDPAFGQLYHNPRNRLPTAEEALASMDAAGVAHAVVMGFGWTDGVLCSAHNDFLDDLVRRHPDRLSAYGAIQPNGPARAAAEVDRLSRLGFRGIGELMPHLQGYSLADERAMGPVAEAAIALGLPIATHSSEPVGHAYPGKGDVTPQTILRLAERWPDLVVVAAHWGGGLPFYELMPEVAAAARNVYYDTAASPLLYRADVFRIVAEIVGPDRILFATDYPMVQQRPFLRKLYAVGLPEATLRRVLGENAARLLGWRQVPGEDE
jgi:predicted TIM-barrel fold metal-dependent hydrolase